MRAPIIIAAFAAVAMFAFALRLSTEDRVIGAPEAEVDNGIGLSWPIDTTKFDRDSNN
jgi:hypothetical protein